MLKLFTYLPLPKDGADEGCAWRGERRTRDWGAAPRSPQISCSLPQAETASQGEMLLVKSPAVRCSALAGVVSFSDAVFAIVCAVTWGKFCDRTGLWWRTPFC